MIPLADSSGLIPPERRSLHTHCTMAGVPFNPISVFTNPGSAAKARTED